MFILAVHFLDWWKTREFNPCDVIINCIVLSNMALQGTILTNEVCFFMFVAFYFQNNVVNSLAVLMSSMAFTSLWCSTCLCFYYCVKIVNISGAFFYKLQAKLPVIVPCLLTLSVLMSWTAGLPAYWDLYLYMAINNDTFPGNLTNPSYFNIKSKCNCLFQAYMLFSSVAFTVIFITAGTIITSLCRHMNRLKKNKEGFSNAKVSSHLSAARTVTLLLLLYLAFYGVLNAIFNETTEVGSLMFSLCFIMLSIFPTTNSIILITGNRKLTNAVQHLLGMKSRTDCCETTNR
ncbi:taste receptor type 2 member 39-like [Pyxicephalus adspersus]